MRYWLVKGQPNRNKFDEMLSRTRPDPWRTQRPIPKDMAAGDRVFLYESSPKQRLVALAVIVDPHADVEGTYNYFTLRYRTPRFKHMPHQNELREMPELADASFLKSANAATIYRLTNDEAGALENLIFAKNPEVANVWAETRPTAQSTPPAAQEPSGLEGQRILEMRFRTVRDASLVIAKRLAVRQSTGLLECEVCGFDFEHTYGELGRDFCEVHHIFPLADAQDERLTPLKDLAILCANCHRMLHRLPSADIQILKSVLVHQRP